jgi:muramoyltetrapeptide carboxypeptidase
LLKKNKKLVGVWSGSSPAQWKPLNKGLGWLKNEEYAIQFPAQSQKWACKAESKQRPYLAGSDLMKAKAFMELWNSKVISHIIGTRGGYGALRLLKHLDKKKLSSNKKKIFWGYSDYTVLQNFLYLKCKSPWVHAPHVNSDSLHSKNSVEAAAWAHYENSSHSKHILKVLPNTFRSNHATKSSKALLVGGNLTSYVSLLGTPWEPQIKTPFYLFLEDLNEAPYRIDRMLTQLSYSKHFSHCKAVILGHFTNCKGWQGVFEKWSQEVKVPVFYGLKAGHERPNIPLVLGVTATLVKKNTQLIELALPNLKLGC